MDWVPAMAAGALAAVFGWFVAGYQHLLYRLPEQRARRAQGRKLLGLRIFVAAACGLAVALAARPDHYAMGAALATAVFGVVLCVVASTDFDQRLIPDRLSYPAMALAAALCWAWPDRSVGSIAIGGLVGLGIGVVLVGVGVFLGGALGLGDGKLILLIGLAAGWPLVMYAVLYGVIFGGVAGSVLIVARGRKHRYAYGPYLALGGLIVLLWPERFI